MRIPRGIGNSSMTVLEIQWGSFCNIFTPWGDPSQNILLMVSNHFWYPLFMNFHIACSSKVGKITYFHQKKVEFFMKNHKILILRSKFHKFYFWSDFNECGMFQRFQNYIQNCSMMNIAESPCLKSIFAIWGSGALWVKN